MVVTTRPDLAYSHCRLSQMLSAPTAGTLRGIKEVMKYLRQSGRLALAAPLHGNDDWNFWVDAGQAGNPLVDVKLRPHLGVITRNHSAPIDWKSTLDSTSFANPARARETCRDTRRPCVALLRGSRDLRALHILGPGPPPQLRGRGGRDAKRSHALRDPVRRDDGYRLQRRDHRTLTDEAHRPAPDMGPAAT